MRLADIRDYVDSLGIADVVYMGKLEDKKQRSIGVYKSSHSYGLYRTAIGGPSLESYGIYYVTLLIHWNRSPRDTEDASVRLFEALRATREEEINNDKIKFIQPLYELQNVGTDDDGIYEMVIEAAVFYER